ncbi:MAG: glycosyltransferase family 1 protein, partial [Alphaproteobacteria bacterium]|nr:glycosyltransferase family 1 protein [Alphaproteobacteria bacterium]
MEPKIYKDKNVMKVAFYNLFGEMKNAEQETLLRLEYCFTKHGHDFIVFDKKGFVISEGSNKGKYIEEINPDFIFTYNTLELGIITFPDVFSMYFHWSPLGFVAIFQTLLEIKAFNSYDVFGCTYEQDVFNRICKITTYDIPFIGSSVPLDFALSARKQTDRKLFYVGINFERGNSEKMRYGKLLQNLNASKQIEIYGPREVYGIKNLWAGFDCYKGEIPFDGKSIIEKINQAGCCLAMNSPMHNDAEGVSNRTYEAAAAGALIISDDNKFVRDYFGDSVFYIDKNLSEEEASQKVLDILNWSNEHPDEAYEMAKRSNEIFKKKLALDDMVKDTVVAIKKNKTAICDVKNQNKVIDLICFAYSQSDYDKIRVQIDRQYYKNINMVVISDQTLKVDKKDTFVKTDLEFKGKAFLQVIPLLKGDFFMFIDANSVMHQRH